MLANSWLVSDASLGGEDKHCVIASGKKDGMFVHTLHLYKHMSNPPPTGNLNTLFSSLVKGILLLCMCQPATCTGWFCVLTDTS